MFNFRKEKEPQDLAGVLKQLRILKKEFKKIEEELSEIKDQGKMSIQKVGIVRYNPFSDTGSDQSFSLALLDGLNNGIVVTSLYSRDGNRVYGKSLQEGKSEYSLSKEEEKAIKQALDGK